jgi:hypothetical protein
MDDSHFGLSRAGSSHAHSNNTDICIPSALAMLPETKADSECVPKVSALMMEMSEEFGAKSPPTRDSWDDNDSLRRWNNHLGTQAHGLNGQSRARKSDWPGMLDPVLKHVDVHTIVDGVILIPWLF